MLHHYFADISADMQRNSERVRRDFATHRPTAGTNREGLVGEFLERYLPRSVEISSGLIAASDGTFSDQADLLLVDQASNAPLYGSSPDPIWLVESVHALFEVKTQLTPTTIADSLAKCVKFKSLPRRYGDTFGKQILGYSLFVLWSFEAPSHATLKSNLVEALQGTPLYLRPDFVVVPGHSVTRSGSYLKVSTSGVPGNLTAQAADMTGALPEPFVAPGQVRMLNTGDNSVLAWLYWLNSWLAAAGPRRPDMLAYVPASFNWGTEV